jgi:hypothetical protein
MVGRALTERNAVVYMPETEATRPRNVTCVRLAKEGGYFSIAGHIALGLGLLELLRTEEGTPGYETCYNDVRELLCALTYNADDAANYRRMASGQFVEILKKGDLKIVLPPIEKENIDEHMKNFVMAEEAAMKSL